MKKIILFSPNGYIGGFVKKRIQENEDVLLHVMTRDSQLHLQDMKQQKNMFRIML